MKKTITAFVILLAGSVASQAALILDISGTAGSSVVSYVASGFITVSSATAADDSNSAGKAPVGGSWNSLFDNNIGDAFLNAASNDNNLSLTNKISYTLNSTQFAEVEAFDLGTTTTAGGDDFQIDMDGTGAISYPELTDGDVVAWSGSGTFTLTTETYDTFFIAGSYVDGIDGNTYNVNIAPVPEPSSAALLGLAGLATMLRRRR